MRTSHTSVLSTNSKSPIANLSDIYSLRRNIRMNLKPLGDRVVILPVEQDDQTKSGLFLPETAKEKPQQGKVIAAGPGSRKENGDRIPMDLKIEDTVLYAKYA